jgi:hypothetical protein
MEDLFFSQERREQEAEENVMASSTIASIASSANDEAYTESGDILVDDLTEHTDEPEFPGVEEQVDFDDNEKGKVTATTTSQLVISAMPSKRPSVEPTTVEIGSTESPSFVTFEEKQPAVVKRKKTFS